MLVFVLLLIIAALGYAFYKHITLTALKSDILNEVAKLETVAKAAANAELDSIVTKIKSLL